jgi:hypothetical protein
LRFRSALKPLITERTTITAETPNATAPMEMRVMSSVAGIRGVLTSSPRTYPCRSAWSRAKERTTSTRIPGRIPVQTNTTTIASVFQSSRRWLRATYRS